MYAIIETGGKQYRVQNGDVIYVEKLDAQVDEETAEQTILPTSSSQSTEL